jgi:Protein of unknown function (DUF1348)
MLTIAGLRAKPKAERFYRPYGRRVFLLHFPALRTGLLLSLSPFLLRGAAFVLRARRSSKSEGGSGPGNRIAVRFAYEWHDDSGNWFRSYANENWEFDDDGLMRLRLANTNDVPIRESERKYHWPLGRRPDNHPGLSDLGF